MNNFHFKKSRKLYNQNMKQEHEDIKKELAINFENMVIKIKM